MEMNKKEVQTRQIKRIENDRARRLAYKKRKECIMKKAMELATLCGVAVCLIVFRPSGELETWPKNPSDVKAVIEMNRDYQSSSKIQGKKKAEMNRDYQSSKIEGKKKKIMVEEEEIEIVDDDQKKEENSKTLWDWDMSWFHGLSTESVKELLGLLEIKIWVIESRMEFLKIIDDNKYIRANSAHWLALDDDELNTADGEDKDIVNWLRICQEDKDQDSVACHEEETGQIMYTADGEHKELRMCQEDKDTDSGACHEVANAPNRLNLNQPLYIQAHHIVADLNQPLYIQPHHTVTDLNQPSYIQPHHIVTPECDYCIDGGEITRNFIDNVNTVPLSSGEILEESETHSKKTYNLLQLARDVIGGATGGTNNNVNTVPLRLDLNSVPVRSDDEILEETETNSNKTCNYLQLFPMNPPQS